MVERKFSHGVAPVAIAHPVVVEVLHRIHAAAASQHTSYLLAAILGASTLCRNPDTKATAPMIRKRKARERRRQALCKLRCGRRPERGEVRLQLFQALLPKVRRIRIRLLSLLWRTSARSRLRRTIALPRRRRRKPRTSGRRTHWPTKTASRVAKPNSRTFPHAARWGCERLLAWDMVVLWEMLYEL